MANTQVNTCMLKDGTMLASYVHPLTKRKVRRTFASVLQVNEYKAKIENKFFAADLTSYGVMTLEELMIFLLNDRPNSTFFKMRLHLIDFTETFGHLPIHHLTTDMLRTWMDQVQQENKVADTTMRSLKCTLDRLFEFLIEKEIISESPLREIYYRKTPADAITRNHLPTHEIEKLLDAVKKYSPGYLYPIIKLFTETGAKVTEIVELKWGQVDCIKRTVCFDGTDRSQARTAPISEELAGLLSKKQRETGFVFKTFYREPFTRIKLTRAINEFKAKGLYRRNWNLLDLRHSFGVNFLSNGGNLRDLQAIMGHANIFDTKRLYGDSTK
ncbi:MAG: tyrosine-type recombinase/integrase [Bdellovibrionaceae bacterium]|nr:tyrosine-type recombinase/integrase [Pseudobdellovibrionaceae bacterium]